MFCWGRGGGEYSCDQWTYGREALKYFETHERVDARALHLALLALQLNVVASQLGHAQFTALRLYGALGSPTVDVRGDLQFFKNSTIRLLSDVPIVMGLRFPTSILGLGLPAVLEGFQV